MKGPWVAPDTPDAITDFVNEWSGKAGLAPCRSIGRLGTAQSKSYEWRARYGRVNEHDGKVPRRFRLEAWEKQAIVDFHHAPPGRFAGV